MRHAPMKSIHLQLTIPHAPFTMPHFQRIPDDIPPEVDQSAPLVPLRPGERTRIGPLALPSAHFPHSLNHQPTTGHRPTHHPFDPHSFRPRFFLGTNPCRRRIALVLFSFSGTNFA